MVWQSQCRREMEVQSPLFPFQLQVFPGYLTTDFSESPQWTWSFIEGISVIHSLFRHPIDICWACYMPQAVLGTRTPQWTKWQSLWPREACALVGKASNKEIHKQYCFQAIHEVRWEIMMRVWFHSRWVVREDLTEGAKERWVQSPVDREPSVTVLR